MIGVAAGAVTVFAACAPVTLLNTITPSGSYKLAKDISYGENARQKYDIYEPTSARANSPVLVFIYGGSWDSGNKGMYKFIGEAFANKGYTIAIADYRLFPEVKYPEFVNDTAAAVAAVSRQFPDRSLVLIGHSAGAYNVVKTTVDASYLAVEKLDNCNVIAGTIGLAGPYGDPPMTSKIMMTIFPGKLEGEDAPINNIDGKKPPLFLAIGANDDTVAIQHGITLAERINAVDGEVINEVYPDLNHTGVIKVISRYFDGDSDLFADMLSFIGVQSGTRKDFCI